MPGNEIDDANCKKATLSSTYSLASGNAVRPSENRRMDVPSNPESTRISKVLS